jgi:succinoglycan biosynthesis protein ExoO
MDNPLFSVVIPLYNKKPHLERCLKSVFSQTESNFELLIIDDDSDDGSRELAEGLISGKDNCRLIHRNLPGPGGYAARNRGIQEGEGDWIAFLDADDEWFPELLSTFKDLIEKYRNVSFFSTAQKRVISEGKIRLDPYSEAYHPKDEITFSLLDYAQAGSKGYNPIQTSSVLAKRSLLLDIGGFPEDRCKRGGDRDTWLRLFIETDMVWTPYIGAVYFRDAVNMVTRNLDPLLSSCMDLTYKSIIHNEKLKDKYGSALSWAIKRQSNEEKKTAYKRKIYRGELNVNHMTHLYFAANPLLYIYLFNWALIPGRLQLNIIKLYKALKGIVR